MSRKQAKPETFKADDPPYDNRRCDYCDTWTTEGVAYGEYFLCHNCEDDGDALAWVAFLSNCVPNDNVILTEQERALLRKILGQCLWDKSFSMAEMSDLSVIRQKIERKGVA